MEVASNFQTLSFGPRISRPHYLNIGRIEVRGHIASAHSNINGVQIDHCLASPFQMQFNAVSAGRIKIGSAYLPGRCAFDLKFGNFTPFRQGSHTHSLRPCRVMSEDSEGNLSGENILLDEETLEQDLKNAIKEENYARAAKIRDSLRLLQEDSKASVLAANARFYNSFKHGDLAAMQTLWSKGENVCVVHPGVSGITGYDLVMGSWEFVWAEYDFPLDIEIRDVQVHVRGDIGYVTCIEMVRTKGSSWGKQFATNVFEKVNGQWFMCIHHASYIDL
ncbi:uncharacterized protein LOC107797087 isoform X1 [Nicotiana tabacum]|uniref:Uncharacterized protein LOC107797087 isoform X1 n=4 Tax=Nicotiana TaxID=4085 RepID=A0A1S4AFG9_TOBAC|nr:PREDICTED: uncharacterized protein LOC104218938 isoform X1 [Nicotiana sylvestris]XP_016475435.1 PREDICTED: uncharacterized protein LOC107797087 [Nicotiana tabacum]